MTRSKLNFDIGADEAPEISAEDIRRATAASGFGAAPATKVEPASVAENQRNDQEPELTRRGKPRTGRVHQLNLRVRAETIRAIQGYADRHSLNTMVEVVERALLALEREERETAS